jgi:hypothetical protein
LVYNPLTMLLRWTPAAVCLQLFVFLASAGAQAKNVAPTPVSPPDAKLPGITVTSAVSDDALNTGQDFAAWLTVTNTGGVPISNLRLLEWTAPGSQLNRISWTGPGGPQSCSLNPEPSFSSTAADSEITVDASSCSPLAAVLAPGQSVSLSGEIKAVRPAPASALHAVIAWTAGGNPSTQGVTMARVEIHGPVSAFFSRVYGFLKDFALPILLAILAYFFNKRDKAREAERQRKADAIAAAQRAQSEALAVEERKQSERLAREETRARDQRTLAAQTWQKRLSVMYELNTKYYLPLNSTITSMVVFRGQRQAETNPDKKRDCARREFFYLALMCRKMNYIADEVGGLFLKDLTGERIIGRCWQSFLKSFTDDFRDEYFRLLTPMLAPMKVDETADAFFSRMDAQQADGSPTKEAAALQKAWQRFQAWIDGASYLSAIQRVGVLRQVLAFEMNRPFLYWYERVEPLPGDGGTRKRLLEALQEFDSTDEDRAASEKQLNEYLEKACRVNQIQGP